MLDDDFCDLLELKISNAFANSLNQKINSYWCDGVYLPIFENYYSEKYVNDNRKIVLNAFAGLSGQDKYEVILIFGPKSLSKYARGLDISECLPDEKRIELFDIDVGEKIIQMILD